MKRLGVFLAAAALTAGAASCGSSETMRSDNGPAITATVPDGATRTTESSGDTTAKDPSTVYMSAPVAIPPGEAGKLSIVAQGAPTGTYGSTVPVVVRNNTDGALTQLEVSGPVRGSDGTLAGSGRSQGFQPETIQPGEWAIGYVYFDSVLPAGATTDLTATGKEPDRFSSSFLEIPVKIAEASLVKQQYGQGVVGILQNASDETLIGTSVMLMCFDGSTPLTARSGYPDSSADLAPGTTTSFKVDLLTSETCPTFALAGSGTRKAS